MDATTSWNAANVISNKFSVGTATTALHSERAHVFQKMNPDGEEKGSLYPQSAFFGADPNLQEDRFVQREVKMLNDISFEEDDDWEEDSDGEKRFFHALLFLLPPA